MSSFDIPYCNEVFKPYFAPISYYELDEDEDPVKQDVSTYWAFPDSFDIDDYLE